MPRQTRNSLYGRRTADSSQIESRRSSPSAPSTSPARDNALTAAVQVEIEQAERTCSVCMQEYGTGDDSENRVKLSCGHGIGLACANRWLMVPGRRNSCPSCKKRLFDTDIDQLNINTQLQNLMTQQAVEPHENDIQGQATDSPIIRIVTFSQSQWTRDADIFSFERADNTSVHVSRG